MRVGVLALQGDFAAHAKALERVGTESVEVRTAEQLARCDALIIPGGESTVIGKLMVRYGLFEAIQSFTGPIWGTCAGLILLGKTITQGEERGGQPTLGLMDISVARNAFGRQIDSFEADIDSTLGPIHGVFIRAPYIVEAGDGVEELASYNGKLVLARQGRFLASAFHPELTDDTTLLKYFLSFKDQQ
ncbi:MAG: pyridoxal 5'-phosphate synthase glutaminase subunit PdxT [Armatimonas sp.]